MHLILKVWEGKSLISFENASQLNSCIFLQCMFDFVIMSLFHLVFFHFLPLQLFLFLVFRLCW